MIVTKNVQLKNRFGHHVLVLQLYQRYPRSISVQNVDPLLHPIFGHF